MWSVRIERKDGELRQVGRTKWVCRGLPDVGSAYSVNIDADVFECLICAPSKREASAIALAMTRGAGNSGGYIQTSARRWAL